METTAVTKTQRYEGLFIVRADAEQAQIDQSLQQVRDALIKRGVSVTEEQIWGRRKLAHPIRKQTDGVYILMRFTSEPKMITQIRRELQILDSVLREFIVVYEPAAEPQATGQGDHGEPQ